MKHETLYKRTKTGAIQYWKIQTRASDFMEGAQIKKESGQLGTFNPTSHVEAIHQGKNIGRSNETTPLEQAESQALSDWTKKHDEGYKSLVDFGITPFTDTKGIQAWKWTKDEKWCVSPQLHVALDMNLPKFNSDAAGNPKPMLATDWNKIKKIEYPCFIQPKLDGVRALLIATEENIIILSRSGKEYTTVNHIADAVVPYMEVNGYPSFILDGEIYSDEISFQEIIQAVKKQYPNSLKLKFRAYDIINDNPQSQRLCDVTKLVDAIQSPYIIEVPTLVALCKEEAKDYHDEFVKQGHEGAMLRLPNGIYGQGQRSTQLLKVKEFDETEFPILLFEKGQRDEDLIAVCITGDRTFKAKMVGNREYKAKLWEDSSKINRNLLTVKHFGLTNDGLPRFPIGKGIRDYE